MTQVDDEKPLGLAQSLLLGLMWMIFVVLSIAGLVFIVHSINLARSGQEWQNLTLLDAKGILKETVEFMKAAAFLVGAIALAIAVGRMRTVYRIVQGLREARSSIYTLSATILDVQKVVEEEQQRRDRQRIRQIWEVNKQRIADEIERSPNEVQESIEKMPRTNYRPIITALNKPKSIANAWLNIYNEVQRIRSGQARIGMGVVDNLELLSDQIEGELNGLAELVDAVVEVAT